MLSLIPAPLHPLLAALAWAVAIILFKRSGDSMSPVGLNTFKNVFALPLFVATGFATGANFSEISPADCWWLVLSGVVGIGIADSLVFMSLNILGASRAAIVETLYSPTIVIMEYLMLGERLTTLDGIGAALILGAITLVAMPRWGSTPANAINRNGIARARITWGVGYGVAAMILMGAAIVAVKPQLDAYDILAANTLRMVGGVGSLVVWGIVHPANRRETIMAFRPQPAWRFAVPGAFIGTYVALLFWIAGFKYNTASIASVLNQTSTIFIVLLAAVFLKEPLDGRRSLAVGLAFGGAILVVL